MKDSPIFPNELYDLVLYAHLILVLDQFVSVIHEAIHIFHIGLLIST